MAAETPPYICPEVSEDGLTILFDNTAKRGPQSVEFGVDIVFVHGLNGHAKKTWCHENGFFWPAELRRVLPQSRVMTFGYNSSVQSEFISNFIRIKGIAAFLNGALVNARSKSLEIHRPLVFVSHSLGGLVAKAALVAMAQASMAGVNDLHYLHDAVRGFVFFGTPHGGSSVLGKSRVNIMKKMCLAAFLEIPPKLEDALRAGSDEALDLADGFRNTKPFVDQKLLIATYYEQLGTPGLSGRVVSEMEATILYQKANPPEPINADHRGMVRFSELESGIAANPVGLLKRWEAKLKAGGLNILPWRHKFDTAGLSFQPEWHVGSVIPANHDYERTMNLARQLREELEESKIRAALEASMWHNLAGRPTEPTTEVPAPTPETLRYQADIAAFMQHYGDALVEQVDVFHSLEQQTAVFQAMLRLTKGSLHRDSDTGRTLMHWLAMNGKADLLPKLQQLGFKTSDKDSDYRTPLHLAVICNHVGAVRVLLEECQADANVKDLRNLLPFHYSLQIDLDNTKAKSGRVEARRDIIRMLAEKTDPNKVEGHLAMRAIRVLKANPEADIVVL